MDKKETVLQKTVDDRRNLSFLLSFVALYSEYL